MAQGEYGKNDDGGGHGANGVDKKRVGADAPRADERRGRSLDPTNRVDREASLDPKVQEQLGRVFRGFCDDLVNQPIPDKFSVLLARLEAKQREKK